MEQGREVLDNPRMAVEIDAPEPLEDLLKAAKPFKAKALEDGLEPEAYVRAFLEPFGADIGKAVLFRRCGGTRIPVSDLLFRTARAHSRR